MADVKDIQIFDADNHLYEDRDAFTKFLPDRYKDVIRYIDIEGRTKILVKNTLSEYIPNPTFEVVAAPGAQEEYFRHGNPEGKSRREIYGEPIRAIPAFRSPEPRLDAMDGYGVEKSMLYPTLGSLLEERLRDDPEATHAVIHAFNQWMYETWQYDFKDRIFTTPVITLPIVERAIEELEWVVERGARAVLIRPAPVPGYRGPRSFALTEFDPFWKRVVELDVFVAMHGSDSGYARYYGEWEGSDTEFLPFQPRTFPMLWSSRSAADAVGSAVCHGLLSRFPELKLAIVELGSRWLAPLMDELSYIYKKMPQDFTEDPIVTLRRNFYLCPFWEEDYSYFAGLLGEDHILFGSDWPHPEGLAVPRSYIDQLEQEGVPTETIRKFMGGNLARLMNMELQAVG
jgi:predicted TIM-barrel fold metal-dependent hydrolase